MCNFVSENINEKQNIQMKRNYYMSLFLLLLSVLMTAPASAQKKTIHTIGDSTMEQRDLSTSDKGGWPQMLPQFITGNLSVNNRGKSGASSKSFYQESAFWQTVVKQLAAGDFLVVQFAHNDEKNGGKDGGNYGAPVEGETDYRGTTASGTFKEYMRKYVDEAQAKGVKVIFATAICRKYFDGTTKIRRNGMHDLGDSFGVPESDDTYDYSEQMKNVAKEYGLPVVDLTKLTAEMYLSYGESYCTENIFCPSDGTHPSPTGATLIARLFVQDVLNQAAEADCHEYIKELASYLAITSDVQFSPKDGSLGKCYPGQTVTKTFSLSALGITPAQGTLTIETTEGFEVSLDGKNFASSQNYSYTGGNAITTVTVRATFREGGVHTGKLTVSNGTMSQSLDLSADVVNLQGAEACSVVWPMNGNNTPVITGPINVIEESWSNMYAKDYNNINSAAIWPEESGYTATRKTQRNCIEGNEWPAGEIDEVSDRYIQFGATAPDGITLSIDNISLYAAGAGGSGMRCKVYYSLNDDFSNPVCIKEMTSMAGNTAYLIAGTPAVDVNPGHSVYVRVYPWYNGKATGKTIALADVTIHAMATGSSDGIISLEKEAQNTYRYFNVAGQAIDPDYSGMVIYNGKKYFRR